MNFFFSNFTSTETVKLLRKGVVYKTKIHTVEQIGGGGGDIFKIGSVGIKWIEKNSEALQIRIRLFIIVRFPFQFVDPACQDTEDLGWESLAEIVFNFFRNDWRFRFFHFKRDTITELGGATEKALSPILLLTLGTTSWSSSEKRRLRVLFKDLSRWWGIYWLTFMYDFICEGAYFVFYSDLNRDFIKGVTLKNRRERVITLAKQFWKW